MAQTLKSGNIFALLDEEEDLPQPIKKLAQKPQNEEKSSRPAKIRNKPGDVKGNPEESKEVPKEYSKKDNKRKAPTSSDRKSRTGRGRETKKEGAGAHNWGQMGADKEAAEEPASEEEAPEEPKEQFLTMSEFLGVEEEEEESKTKETLTGFRIPRGPPRKPRRGEERREEKPRGKKPRKQQPPKVEDANAFPTLS